MTMSLAAPPRPEPGHCHRAVGGAPLIRIRPAPSFEPPYDDEPPDDNEPPGPGERRWLGPLPGPGERRGLGPLPGPGERRGLGPLPGPGERSGEERWWGPAPAETVGGLAPRAGTGGQAAYRYVGLCLEVLDGFRPAAHLRRLTLPAAFASVLEQLARPAARAGHASSATPLPGGRATAGSATVGSAPAASASAGPTRRAGPAGNPRRAGGPGNDRLRLRRLWVGEPSHGVVEAAAVLGRADRAWALALRLERREDAWLCTDLQVI